MGGSSESPSHRSSSPLKRPASSMEQISDTTSSGTSVAAGSHTVSNTTTPSTHTADAKEDVDMISLPPTEEEGTALSTTDANRPKSEAGSVPPPIEEQIQTIEELVKRFNSGELEEGATAYLVSRRWLAPAQALGSGDAAKAAKEVPHGTLGPVDNTDIIDCQVQDINGAPAVRLKPGIGQENFEYFPKEAWDLLVSWYGLADGQLPIVRYAHNTAPNSMIPNVQYELHPPVFTLHRLWSVNSGIPHDREVPDVNQPAPVVMCSSNCNIQTFLKRAKILLHIPMGRPVRMWRVPRKLAAGSGSSSASAPPSTVPSSLSTPPDSPKLDASHGGNGRSAGDPDNPQDSWSKLLLEGTDFMKLQNNAEREQLSQVKDMTHDGNFNGRSTLAFIALTVDQTIVLDENVERNHWVSTYSLKSGGKVKPDLASRSGNSGAATSASTSSLVGAANAAAARASAATSTAASSGRSSPSRAGPVTRGRAKHKSGRTLGCVGLSNLGNTCYMNSALQCLRSVEELTKYFLVHENELEINHSNPLGHGGNVANAYAYLLDEIYKDTVPMSISPRQFKSTIGRYAPSFSGYGQQDSQEFLGFLLDGLQEDLSRVKKKPYIAKPDSTDEMINNPAAIREMAEKVWDITKRRDDSIIADLFTGMYKSTLICPVCQKVSITFDPFTNLTLPLPIQNVWSKSVRFVPLNDHPVYMEVELDKTSSIRALKEFISSRVDVPVDRLVVAEELRDNIIKIYDDLKAISEDISPNDTVVVFEVETAPTNNSAALMPRKKHRSMLDIDEEPEIPDWENPLADRLLVPVLHRFDPNHQRRRFTKGSGMAGPPHFIVLNRDEARSEDAIRRKILEKVASFSTWSGFAKAEENLQPPSEGVHEDGAADATDHDLVVATASDVDSSGDSKVVAKSVEGEDDLVDVTMNDAGDTSSQSKQPSSKVLYRFNRRRPKWVTDSSIYLTGEMQNSFDMGYYSDDQRNLIPTKWTSSNEAYPKIRSRVPQPPAAAPSADQETSSPSNWESAGGSENESSQEEEEEAATGAAVASEMTRMADESDEEESVLPAAQNLALRNSIANKGLPGRRKALKPHQRTYGTKGARRRQRQLQGPVQHQHQDPDDDNGLDEARKNHVSTTAVDGGPLIRLGEGIMVDWHPDAWDLIYGKEGPDDHLRGEPTYLDPLPVVDDPELQEKRQKRQSRRKRGLTLDECLDEFEREEILSENDTWYCPRCKEHRRASKKFDLWKTPDILVVHLKRFSSSGWRRDKLDTRVDFPVEGLDLTKRVLDRQTGKLEVYDLIAVDDHWGGLGGGHYTAFAKNFVDHQWYEYNDSSVSKVSDPSRVVSSAAYLLFYRRRSDVPLGGPRFQKIEEKFNHQAADSDDDVSESGEGQRLDTGSSLIGSSSASKGAEAGLRHRASPGLGSSGTSSLTLNANGGATLNGRDGDEDDSDYLPPYGPAMGTGITNGSRARIQDVDSADEYEENGGETGDLHSSLIGTTRVLNFGGADAGASGNAYRDDDRIHKSVEMEDRYGNLGLVSGGHDSMDWTAQDWSFRGIGASATRNSPGSDVADVDELELGDAATATASGAATAHDPDQMSLGSTAADFGQTFSTTAATGVDEGEDLRAASQSPPPPDPFAQASMEDIQQQVWARKEERAGRVHTVMLPDDEDPDSEKAVDIHISEDEAAKTDS